jgi:hypothetical protein
VRANRSLRRALNERNSITLSSACLSQRLFDLKVGNSLTHKILLNSWKSRNAHFSWGQQQNKRKYSYGARGNFHLESIFFEQYQKRAYPKFVFFYCVFSLEADSGCRVLALRWAISRHHFFLCWNVQAVRNDSRWFEECCRSWILRFSCSCRTSLSPLSPFVHDRFLAPSCFFDSNRCCFVRPSCFFLCVPRAVFHVCCMTGLGQFIPCLVGTMCLARRITCVVGPQANGGEAM